jgi:glyoxylase-like metal-dependent hydrolase (beta-lactamase superfamily II)
MRQPQAEAGTGTPRPRYRAALTPRRLAVGLLVRLGVGSVLLFVLGEIFLHTGRGATSPPVEVTPGVVGERGVFGWLYAVRTSGGVVLFDAGMDARGRPVDAALSALAASRPDVTDVFLTHGHVDEAAGVVAVPRARVHAGEADAELAAGGVPRHGVQRLIVPLFPRPQAHVADRIPGERSIVLPGGEVVLAIPVPGHTAGSTAYLLDGTLFVGDAAEYRDGQLDIPDRWFSSDPAQAERSLAALSRRVVSLPVRRICCGHGGCAPEGRAVELLQDFAARAR